ncbi:hypothetical protein ACFX2I_005397 [Malus domestica]
MEKALKIYAEVLRLVRRLKKIPSRQIGKVIGKEGCRIQKIREETKANIKITDAIARHEERGIIISSNDSDDSSSDAEKALQ